MKLNLLTVSNPKTLKGETQGYLTAILHLSPADRSGRNVCPKASESCREVCLNTAGRGGALTNGTNRIQECRIRRTQLLFNDPGTFWTQLTVDIFKVRQEARKRGMKVAIRLNGTSDLPWERMKSPIGKTIFETFPDIQFYDYTKVPNRTVPSNYHLTFSLSESNTGEALEEMDKGRNVAVVFFSVPKIYAGRKVVDGDVNDLRFLDPTGVVVGLKAKGKARKDTSGFVR